MYRIKKFNQLITESINPYVGIFDMLDNNMNKIIKELKENNIKFSTIPSKNIIEITDYNNIKLAYNIVIKYCSRTYDIKRSNYVIIKTNESNVPKGAIM